MDLGRTSNASARSRRSFFLWDNPICDNVGDSMRRRRFFLAGRFVPRFVWCFLSLDVFALVVHIELCDFPAALPFLNEGLRSLDKRAHSLLCFVLLLLYSLFPYSFLNGLIRFDMSYSVWLFVYQYVLITCLRWHYSEFLLNRCLGKRLLVLGLALGIGTQVLFGFPLLIMGKSMLSHQLWLNTPACLPPMFFALGTLIIVSTKNPRTNLIINKAATGTLAVYLILTDTVASRLIGGAVGSLGLNGMVYMMFSLAVAMGVFVSSMLFDLLRQRLMRPFSSMINRAAEWVIVLLHEMAMAMYGKCLRLGRD